MPPRPTLDDVRRALVRVAGAQRAEKLYNSALVTAGVSGEARDVPVTRVLEVARIVQGRDGVVSLVGLAQAIRCETYLALTPPEERV